MDENDTIDALQAGHSHATEHQIYGLSPEALPGAAEDIIHLFLQARWFQELSRAGKLGLEAQLGSEVCGCRRATTNQLVPKVKGKDAAKQENEGTFNQLHKDLLRIDEQPTGFDEHLLHMIGQLPCCASIVNEGLDPTLFPVFPVARGDDEMNTYCDLLPVTEDPHVNQKSQRNPGGKQKGKWAETNKEFITTQLLQSQTSSGTCQTVLAYDYDTYDQCDRMQEVSLTPGSSKITQTPTLTNAQTQITLNNEEVHSDYSAWGVVIHIPLERGGSQLSRTLRCIAMLLSLTGEIVKSDLLMGLRA
ncbi:hypothetical protein BKA82DRAFT_4020491 [Pisolithus tinctorius]|nr:hypothetical protein BKA82DRAFT_4020491 [Pisolithus tinctorius]